MVLDDQHRQRKVAGNVPEQDGEGRGFLGVHPRCGLVQEQDRGIWRQSPGEFQPPLVPVGERSRHGVAPGGEPHELQEFQSPGGAPRFLAPYGGGAQQGGGDPLGMALEQGGAHVFQGALAGEEPDVLERPSHPSVDDDIGAEPLQRVPFQQHLAGGGDVEPRDEVEHGGFPGAVGADEPQNFSPLHGEGETVHRPDPSEGSGELPTLKQGSHDATSPGSGPKAPGTPATPGDGSA